MSQLFVVVVEPEREDQGRLWVSPRGVRYAFFKRAIDGPPGVAILGDVIVGESLDGQEIREFSTLSEAAAFVREVDQRAVPRRVH